LDFTKALRATLPTTQRYAAVAFLGRYLGYSRAAPRDRGQSFSPASTSSTINRYFDNASPVEDPVSVAREIMQAFGGAIRFFDIDDERLAFFRRNEKGKRKFNSLIATTHMIGARFLLDAMEAGLATEGDAINAARHLTVPYPDNQQTSTIWDYQARFMMGLRDALGVAPNAMPLEDWASFFQKMAFVRIPDS